MVPSRPGMQALAVLTDRTVIHGHPVQPGNLVIQVQRLLQSGLKPLCPGPFDEEELVCEGGFYEWPSSCISFLNIN